MTKTNITKSILALFLSGLVFTACTKEDIAKGTTNIQGDVKSDNTTQTLQDLSVSVKLDNAVSKAINKLDKFPFKKATSKTTSNPFDCMNYETSIKGGTSTTAISFSGEEGCDILGQVYKGKVTYSTNYDKDNMSYVESKTYENFSINGVSYNGTFVSKRQYKVEGKDPQTTYSMDLTMTLEDGKTVIRKGESTSTFLGTDTTTMDDDAFETTGSWVNTLEDGTTYYYNVTTPVRYIYTCIYPVSGTVEIKDTENEGVLNYGDGECDDEATFTNKDGDVIQIEL